MVNAPESGIRVIAGVIAAYLYPQNIVSIFENNITDCRWNFDWKLGSLIHLDSPDLHLQVLKKVTLEGEPGRGCFVEAGINHNAKTLASHVIGTIQQEFSPHRRFVLCASRRAFFGQKLELAVNKKWGFQHFRLCTELQAGVDLARRKSFTHIDLDSYSVKPLWHPAVVAGAGLAYMSMFKFRNRLPITFTAGSFPVRNRIVEVQLQSNIQRLDVNLVTTAGIRGVLLTLHL